MKLTGNALSMLLKRYRAVLGKCRTLNWLAGMVLAGGLVLGGVSGALAAGTNTWKDGKAPTPNASGVIEAGTYTITGTTNKVYYPKTADTPESFGWGFATTDITGNSPVTITIGNNVIFQNSMPQVTAQPGNSTATWDDYYKEKTGNAGLLYAGARTVNGQRVGDTIKVTGGAQFIGNNMGAYGVLTSFMPEGIISVTGTNYFRNNVTTDQGAAISAYGFTFVDGAVFTGNKTTTDQVYSSNKSGAVWDNQIGGGAVFLGANGKTIIQNATFGAKDDPSMGNSSASFGGAISTRGYSTTSEKTAATNAGLTIQGSNFYYNTAAFAGGAIFNTFSMSASSEGGTAAAPLKAEAGGVQINNSNFIGNTAGKGTTEAQGYGGAIYNIGSSSPKTSGVLVINGGLFDQNSAASRGGAIYNTGTLTINNAIFTNNKTTNVSDDDGDDGFGGAIFLSYQNAGIKNYNDPPKFEEGQDGRNDASKTTITTITGGRYSYNSSTTAGGAISMQPGQGRTILTLNKVDFDHNESKMGGAIGAFDQVTVNGGSFTYNEATEDKETPYPDGGGAIAVGSLGNLTVNGASFSNNKSNFHGGAIATRTHVAHTKNGTSPSVSDGKVTITGAEFKNNSALQLGGAIYNTFNAGLNSTGEAIGDSGVKVTYGMLISASTFSNNTDGGSANNNNDIHNVGGLAFGSGVTTLNSGYRQARQIYPDNTSSEADQAATANVTTLILPTATVNMNSLDIQNGHVFVQGALNITSNATDALKVAAYPSTPPAAQPSAQTEGVEGGQPVQSAQAPKRIILDGGSMSTYWNAFFKTPGTNDKKVVTQAGEVVYTLTNNAIGVSSNGGTLYLNLGGQTYTAAAIKSVQQAIFEAGSTAKVGFVNANLDKDDAAKLTIGNVNSGGAATIGGSPTFGTGSGVPEAPAIPNIVVKIGETLGEVATISTATATKAANFAVSALQIGTATGTNGSVTLTLGKENDKMVFTGSKRGIVVNAAGDAVTTNVTLSGTNSQLQLGENIDPKDYNVNTQVFELAKVDVKKGTLSVINSDVTIDTLTGSSNGAIFVDPSYLYIKNLTASTDASAGTLSSNLFVGVQSATAIAFDKASLKDALTGAGYTLTDTVSTANGAVLAIGKPITLGYDAANTAAIKLIVDPNVDNDGNLSGTAILGTPTAYFGDGSVLVFDASKMGTGSSANPVIKANDTSAGQAYIHTGAALVPYNVKNGQEVTILSGFNSIATDAPVATGSVSAGTGAAGTSPNTINGGNDIPGGWSTSVKTNQLDRLLKSTVKTDVTGKNVVLTTEVNDRAVVEQNLPGLDGGLVTAMMDTWEDSNNNVNSTDKGIQFLSRAANRGYIADNATAAKTIEGAARMVTIGAVPQMTRTANQAAAEAVTQRTSMAIPSSIQTQQATDRVALWIMPLYQSTNGSRLDAGNFDADYHGGLGGIALGADYTFANAIRAGIAFNIGAGYATGGGDFADTTNNMNFWGLGAYAGWTGNNIGVSADVNFTSAYNKLTQDLPQSMGMRDLKADVRSWAFSTGLRGEYKLETSALDITPHVGVRFMYLTTDDYKVKSEGTVLKGDGLHQNIWTFPIGVSFSKNIERSNGWHVKPMLDLAVVPAAGDIKAKENVRFSGTDYKAELETQVMDYITYQGVLGVEVGNENLTFGLSGNTQFGEKTSGYGVLGSFRYEF